jgi:hypothetical protein
MFRISKSQPRCWEVFRVGSKTVVARLYSWQRDERVATMELNALASRFNPVPTFDYDSPRAWLANALIRLACKIAH